VRTVGNDCNDGEVVMDDGVVGPIDCVLLDFDAEQPLDDVGEALNRLIEIDVIRLYDILVVRKSSDGSVVGVEVADLGDDVGLTGLAGARSGLLGDDDVATAGAAMDPGTAAMLLLYENAWAVPVVAATRRAGGVAFAVSHVTGQQINDALDALEEGD
jgi:uncharacterized membrane protein